MNNTIASLLALAKKAVTWDKSLAVYKNGEDNAYSERMERLRNNSVTASMASGVMAQYVLGKGFGEADNLLIGDRKLIEIAEDAAKDITDNCGVFVHVTFDLNYKPAAFDVLPFHTCKIGEKDSKDYNGKILVYPDWTEKNVKKDKVRVIDVFNPEEKIVKAQVDKCKGSSDVEKLGNYKGQILFLKMDRRYIYPLSRIDSVAFECDNEYRTALYKNTLLDRGFYGKTLVITRPLIEKSFFEDDTKEGLKKLKEKETEVEAFQKAILEFISVGNVGGTLHLQVEFSGDKLEDAIVFKNIESNIDDKLFAFTEDSASKRILMAFNNMPVSLVKSPDSALLGNSGESLNAAKLFFWENTSKERNALETLINDLYQLIPAEDEQQKEYLYIQDLLEAKVDEDAAASENAKAQAQLKGSVGGVTALLSIQQSVSTGATDREAAVKIIEVIFGIDPVTAAAMLGTPAKVDPPKNVT